MTLQILVMRALIILIPTLVGLAGCSSWAGMPSLSQLNFLTPYKVDIRQGNYISESMVDKLQLGMTRSQVQYVMGTALLSDVFHADRWDYVYYFRKDGKEIANRRVTLYFEGDKLTRIVKLLDKGTPAGNTPETVASPKA